MAHRSLSSGDRLLRQRILTSPPGRSRPLFNSPHQCSAYISGTVYTPAMSRIAIKICGLSTPETVDAAIHAGASHVGMVFFRKSPRHVDFDKAAALAARMPDHVRSVGVFVDPDEELLEHAISSGNLHALQLHGKEQPERSEEHTSELQYIMSISYAVFCLKKQT